MKPYFAIFGSLFAFGLSASAVQADRVYDGTQAEIVEESSISSIIPNGTKVKLGLKLDKLNVFTADGEANLTKGVVNDVR
jgi:hypothetical protein